MSKRAKLEVETLLKIVLGLVIVWILVDIAIEVLEFIAGPLSSLIGLLIIVLIMLWLFDKL